MSLPLIPIYMEPIIKETQVIRDHGGWDGNTKTNTKANWALGLGILGSAAGLTALARQGGLNGLLGGAAPAAPAASPITYNAAPVCCPANVFAKECDDILNVTKGMYDLFIVGQQSAAKAREIDVAEKFGLYVNNRDNIDRVNGRINDELFSLYKYTRDKDDETNAKIYDLAQQVAINTAVRPYQDKLIMCEIGKVYDYVDKKTCRFIPGRLVLPSTPTVTGYSADCPCPGTAEAGA